MNLFIRFLLTIVVFIPLSVSAEIMHYSSCTLNDGKTMADAQEWVDDWRPIAKRAGIDYKIRLLTGHAAPADAMLPNFAIEGSSSTLSTYAKAWEWWYSAKETAKSNAQLQSIATCGSNSVFTTTE